DEELLEVLHHVPGVSDDIVRDMLSKLSRTPLLSAEEEVTLAKQIEAGLLARERLENPLFDSGSSRRAERDLRWIAARGVKAFNHFVTSNLRLVHSIAKRYAHHGLDHADVVQEGTMG